MSEATVEEKLARITAILQQEVDFVAMSRPGHGPLAAAPDTLKRTLDFLTELPAELTRLRAENEKWRALTKRLSTALLKVRPLGGSELFTKVGNEYYADPDYCGAAIEDMRQQLHETRLAIARLRKGPPRSAPGERNGGAG